MTNLIHGKIQIRGSSDKYLSSAKTLAEKYNIKNIIKKPMYHDLSHHQASFDNINSVDFTIAIISSPFGCSFPSGMYCNNGVEHITLRFYNNF